MSGVLRKADVGDDCFWCPGNYMSYLFTADLRWIFYGSYYFPNVVIDMEITNSFPNSSISLQFCSRCVGYLSTKHIEFNILLVTFNTLNNLAPQYILVCCNLTIKNATFCNKESACSTMNQPGQVWQTFVLLRWPQTVLWTSR